MYSRRIWPATKIRPLRPVLRSQIRCINPFLPVDILDEVTNDDENTIREKRKLKRLQDLDEKIKNKKDGPINEYQTPQEEQRNRERQKKENRQETWERFGSFLFRCCETAGITFSSLAVLALSGYMYHKIYNSQVLSKINSAFDEGDPTLQLSMYKRTDNNKYWVERPQQLLLDDIVNGKIKGRYFLLVGEKGTGKFSAILQSIRSVKGLNCTVVDGHSDPEIFRIRLGQALNFEYHEDYIGSLFSIRGPRDTTALLDIERAFKKLEMVALKRVKSAEKGVQEKPLIIVINNTHLIKDDEEGNKLIELLQQKAESLSGSGLATMIFNSDDYWVYERMKQLSTRLEVINFNDLGREDTIKVLKAARMKHYNEYLPLETANKIYDLIGGRPQHLALVSANKDPLLTSHQIIDREKTWFLNQCGLLGGDMDDDVMESGKLSTSAMLLMRELVQMDREKFSLPLQNDDKIDHVLPSLPLWRARQVMTRPDYIQLFDNLNIFTIDCNSRVHADSVPMMRAFHEIASQPGFDELLNETIERVSEIESLGRTRELVAKDLLLGGHYTVQEDKNNKLNIKLHGGTRDLLESANEDEPIKMEDFSDGAHKKWWSKRMSHYRDSYKPEEVAELGLTRDPEEQNSSVELSKS
ncbi:hypothetical protein LJB42_003589 [Komagataella kurtzmanii]|nr:hypothetical protein LJB42_003589 [Komagataella kurtzmanii]